MKIKILLEFLESDQSYNRFVTNSGLNNRTISNKMNEEIIRLKRFNFINLRKYVNNISVHYKKTPDERNGWIRAIKAFNKKSFDLELERLKEKYGFN